MDRENKINNSTTDDVKSKVIKFFDYNSHVDNVYLFGSVLTGRLNQESDIDVAIIVDDVSALKNTDLIHLREELSEVLHRDVDIVRLNNAPVILRMQVFRKGIKLFDRNPMKTNRLIVRSQFEYDDLKHVRSTIERQILRGRVCG